MKNRIKRISILIYCILLSFSWSFSAFAEETLPEGSAAGLPEKLTVLDSDGQSVSAEGEYFFLVEGMQPYVEYSKDIQIMNLREDKAYHIYFYAEPLDKAGDIDLEAHSVATFTLNGEKIFKGDVNGLSEDGTINLKESPIDLGLYKPGDSGKMNCTIVWDGQGVNNFIDNGERVVDADGTHVIREKEGEEYVYGEVRFRWIFYAAVDESYEPPKTGIAAIGQTCYVFILGGICLMILIMIVMIERKRRTLKNNGAHKHDGL